MRGASRWAYLALAYSSITLAALGVALPGLPTVPFLLVAAWAAPKGSSRLDTWLRSHPRFGPALHDWAERRAVSRPTKERASLMLALSWSLLLWLKTPTLGLIALATLFVAVASYIWTRPDA